MIPVNRAIEYFNKSNEEIEELGVLIGKYDISEISLIKLKEIVIANPDDDNLYDVYELNSKQLTQINELLNHPINYFLDKFDYCLTCSAVAGYYK
jgi:hypothetical protein